MKKFIFLLLSFVFLALPVTSLADITADQVYHFDKWHRYGRKFQLGTNIKANVQDIKVVRGTYDFSVQGGSTGSAITLDDSYGDDVTIPDNSVITKVIIDVLTVPDSAGDGASVSVGAAAADDLLGATAEASVTGIVAGVPDGTAANAIKLTADKALAITVTDEALTSGKFDVFVYYLEGQ